MLAQLILELKPENGLKMDYYKASLLQGILMEQIDPAYAARLHEGGLNPYSQCLCTEKGSIFWRICALNQEAYQNVLIPAAGMAGKSFYLEHNQEKIEVLNCQMEQKDDRKWHEELYSAETDRYITVEFYTPTAFKSQGQYIFYPDLRLIYQSLMNRYDTVSEDVALKNAETLEQLTESSTVVRYRLKSTVYHLEGIRIPAFLGSITVKVNGPRMMVNFANILFNFGCFSGVGIKTSMGMGAMKRIEGRKENSDKG